MQNFTKIKSPSRADLVVDKITNSIINGELSDGELLPPENQLCEIFGVSRSILREAIRVLASKGLVEVRQGYGTLVCVPKVDIGVVKLAAERREEKHVKTLAEALAIMQSHSANVEALANADKEFHKTLIEASGNPLFGIMIRPIMRYLHLSRQLAIRHFGIAVVIKEHQAIFEAIKKQQTTSVVTAMQKHMEGALSRIDEVNKLLKKKE
jgi:GntR family transcriptional repressor for pyruvate dehydrogenase complex